jgi:hypothetical protein
MVFSMADTKISAEQQTNAQPGAERRRAPLPQPDFSPYEKAEAYPGPTYFFVGHSYDTALDNAPADQLTNRAEAIKSLFVDGDQYVSLKAAQGNQSFCTVLTRFEQDLLNRLPDTSVIGIAVDPAGKLIPQSFTIWRVERRRRSGQ